MCHLPHLALEKQLSEDGSKQKQFGFFLCEAFLSKIKCLGCFLSVQKKNGKNVLADVDSAPSGAVRSDLCCLQQT